MMWAAGLMCEPSLPKLSTKFSGYDEGQFGTSQDAVMLGVVIICLRMILAHLSAEPFAGAKDKILIVGRGMIEPAAGPFQIFLGNERVPQA